VLRVHVDRHSTSIGPNLSFGCFNIDSLANKVDDILDVRRDSSIDILLLVEAWHDSDSVSLRRLLSDGFQVVECPRPRPISRRDSVLTNHGGVAAVAVPGIKLLKLDIGATPDSFEFICVRVSSGSSSCVVVLIYRPGSVDIKNVARQFFEEFQIY